MRAVAVVTLTCCIATTSFAQQQPRDGRRVALTGTARITGVVMSDEAQPKPLRRARVMLNAAELDVGRTAITNDDGTFAFNALPAGRYTISALKAGYVTLILGARRTGHPGTPLTLRDGESRAVTVRIPRGGVITGAVTDHDGQPAPGIAVTALTYRSIGLGGQRGLVPAGLTSSTTDDRGVYRIFSLPAGEYLVAAQVRAAAGASGELQVLSPAEVARALAEVRQASRTRGGAPTARSEGVSAEPRKNVAYAPVFYPGTTTPAQAKTLSVAAGEERSGIDFQLEYVPTANVQGSVVMASANAPASTVFLLPATQSLAFEAITRSARTGPEGRFMLTSVPPGRYSMIARVNPDGATSGGAPLNALFATTEIVVDGQDITDIVLSPQPGLTITGRIAFDGTTPIPPLPLSMRLSLPIGPASAILMAPPTVRVESDWRFEVTGIMPGPFRASALSGVRSPVGRWWLKSILLKGSDLLDAPLEFRQSAEGAIITFSDRASELAGVVTDAQGEPTSSHYVIAFSTDRTSWFYNSRRVAAVRPDAQGRYKISNLPPGDYLITLSDDLEQYEWFEAAVLQKLTPGAMKVAMSEYERKTLDMTVPAR